MSSPFPCKCREKENVLIGCFQDAVVKAGDFAPKVSFLPLTEENIMHVCTFRCWESLSREARKKQVPSEITAWG